MMRERLRRFLAPPVFEGDEGKTSLAAVFNTLLWSFLLLLAAYAVLAVSFFVVRTTATLLIIGCLVAVWFAARALLLVGRIRFAIILWLATLWALSTGLELFGGGVRTSFSALYLAIPALAGLLLGSGGAFMAIGACGLTVAGMAGLEATGQLPPPYFPNPPGVAWTYLVFTMAYTVVPLISAVNSANRALLANREQVRERIRAEAALTRRTQQLETVRAVSEEITRELDLAKVLRLIVERSGELVEGGQGVVSLWDDAARVLVTHAAVSQQGRLLPAVKLGEGLVGMVAERRTGLIVNDYRSWPGALPAVLERGAVAAAMAEPLLYRDNLIGVIYVTTDEPGVTFNEQDQQHLRLLANQTAIAIENARLFREEQQRREQLEAIRLVSAEIARELDIDRLLDLILRRAVELAGAEGGAILLWNEADQKLFPRVRIEEFFAGMPKRAISLGEGLVGRVAAERKGAIVNDYRTWEGARKEILVHTAIVASLAEPLLYRDTLIGVINLANTGRRGSFREHHGLLLRHFADQAAIAIENARLFRATQQELAERTRAEDALRRYRLLADHARDIVLFVHRDTGRIIEANRAAAAAYGYPLPELLTRSIHDLRASETRALTADQLVQADAEGILFESVHLRRDGTTFPVEVSSRGTSLDGERVLLSIIRDITDRKRTETSLQTHTQQLEVVRAVTAEITRELNLDRLLDLILRRAIELAGAEAGVIMLWDEGTQTLFPRVRIGEFWATMPKRPIPLGEGVVGHVAQTRQALIINDYRAWPGARPVALAHTAITASLGEPLLYRDTLVGVIVLIHTGGEEIFTEHHGALLRLFAAQAAIAIENARLFQEQQQSFGELKRAQEELVRTEKLRALGQMSAGIAHDLNNMLAAVLGQAELLRLQVKLPEVQEALNVLSTAASDGAQVVRRLLEFGRQHPTRPLIPCDLVSLVDESLEITRPRWQDEAQEQGRQIDVWRVVENLPRIQGNPAEIREVLTNLVLNAVDAMPTGGRLTVAGYAETVVTDRDAPGRVVLTVSDTGTGMTEETRRRIFDPFFTTKGFKGTGLGLAVVYSIMERHGGRIEVASAPGHGTTFTLRFQGAVAAEGEAAAAASPAGTCRLLLIDDEAPVRMTIASLLRAVGHTVIEADSGDQGLAGLVGGPVDLVITDLGMPGMTGWEVAQRIKTAHPDLPVILLTGWGHHLPDPDQERDAVDMVLAKPVRLADLQDAIARVTASRGGGEVV